MSRIVVTGIADLDKSLRKFDAKLGSKIVRGAIRKVLKSLGSRLSANAPKGTGKLGKAVKVRAGKRARGAIKFVVGWFAGDGKFYASFADLGRKGHPGARAGKKTIDEGGASALAEAEREIRAGIASESSA